MSRVRIMIDIKTLSCCDKYAACLRQLLSHLRVQAMIVQASPPLPLTLIARLCVVGFLVNCQPSEPFLTRYLMEDKARE